MTEHPYRLKTLLKESRPKVKQEGYPQEIIDRVIAYVRAKVESKDGSINSIAPTLGVSRGTIAAWMKGRRAGSSAAREAAEKEQEQPKPDDAPLEKAIAMYQDRNAAGKSRFSTIQIETTTGVSHKVYLPALRKRGISERGTPGRPRGATTRSNMEAALSEYMTMVDGKYLPIKKLAEKHGVKAANLYYYASRRGMKRREGGDPVAAANIALERAANGDVVRTLKIVVSSDGSFTINDSSVLRIVIDLPRGTCQVMRANVEAFKLNSNGG